MGDGGPVEVTAQVDEGQARQRLCCPTVPQDDTGAGAHHPLRVGPVDVHRRVAEGGAPLDAGPVEMWVRYGDGVDATPLGERGHGLLVDETEAVPEQVAGGGLDQERPLADPEVRLGPQGREPGFLVVQLVAVAPGHVGHGRPPLATPAHVLSFVLADGTGRRRPVGLGVLDPAGHADVARHRNGITPLSTQLVPS